jgi:hypothetical protein
MKQTIQIIALNLFGLNALQIILAIGVAVILLQAAAKTFPLISGWKAKRSSRKLEEGMWAIE